MLERVERAKAEGIPISEHGEEMRLIKDYYDTTIDCAAKLALYIHPRLSAVEVKTEQPQPFVICAPAVVETSDEWVRSVSAKIINGAKAGAIQSSIHAARCSPRASPPGSRCRAGAGQAPTCNSQSSAVPS